jgi:hypothetical protein
MRKYGRSSGAVLCQCDKTNDKDLVSLAAQTDSVPTVCQLTQTIHTQADADHL